MPIIDFTTVLQIIQLLIRADPDSVNCVIRNGAFNTNLETFAVDADTVITFTFTKQIEVFYS